MLLSGPIAFLVWEEKHPCFPRQSSYDGEEERITVRLSRMGRVEGSSMKTDNDELLLTSFEEHHGKRMLA